MKIKKNYSRREFISTSAKGAAVISASSMLGAEAFGSFAKDTAIPRRILGKTGLSVSILSFGGGSQFLKNEDGTWEQLLQKAIDSGINLFDTAPEYTIANYFKNGEVKKSLGSEERFGAVLAPYRKDIHLITKIDGRDATTVKKSVEDSLKNMKTDYLDALLIHAITDKDSVSDLEKGVYKEVMDLKRQGIARFIGFSSMDSAERSKDLLMNLDFDIAMLAINPTKYRSYASIALPVAREKNVGIIAIKVMRDIVGKDAKPGELFEYVWTEGNVTAAMVGHTGIKTLEENIKLAVRYGKKAEASIDRKEIENRLASYAGPHALSWARPGYRDGGIFV
ncbi:MAG TPA: aldo/keto reductase [Bacteroidales bacterium]|nr:aldo/keto reductase [Bacteroidales bacterium]